MRKLKKGINDLETIFPNLAAEWDFSRNGDNPSDYTYRSGHRAYWKCSICGNEWIAKIRDRVDSKYQLCPKCTAKKRGEERHLNILKLHGGISDPLLVAEWDYEKNERGPEEYSTKSNDDAYWICSKCGYHFKARINNRALRKSCACCSGKVIVPGINDLATTHPKLAAEWHPTKNGALRPTEVSHGQATVIWWVCPEGHEYTASLLHRSSGTNCPKCNSGRQTSFAEQAIYYYVKKVFPDAISRYTEIFSKGMELDIYIPSTNLGIEYDGMAWHKEDRRSSETKKYKICQENGIRLLRLIENPSKSSNIITADESLSIEDGPMYEKKHLEKAIRLLLDKIDPELNMWTMRKPVFHSKVDINIERDESEIRKYMIKIPKISLAKEYPELAKEWHPTKNGQLTPDKVKPHSDIVVWWLCPKCGYEYEASIGHRSYGTGCPKCGVTKSAHKRSKQVVMLDPETGESIKVFTSISEASRELGINPSNISMACKGQRKKAGGYIWRYRREYHE